MQLVYTGIHQQVEIADVPGVTATRGEPVDIPDEVAKRLLEQVDAWRKVSAGNTKGRKQAGS